MAWSLEFDKDAVKDLKKLDRQIQKRILQYLKERVIASENPRTAGKALRGPLKGLWRYRVGDYRVICHIEDQKLVVLVLRAGNRRHIYSA